MKHQQVNTPTTILTLLYITSNLCAAATTSGERLTPADGCAFALDKEFLATVVDNTVGTYTTNYAIGVVCLLALALLRQRNWKRNSNNIMGMIYLNFFFLSTGLSYTIAGVGHQIVESKSDPLKPLFEGISYALYGISSFALIFYGLQIIDPGIAPTINHAESGSTNFKCYTWWIVFVLLSGVISYMTYLNSLAPFGVLGILTYVFIIIITFIVQGRCCTACCKRQNGTTTITRRPLTLTALRVIGLVVLIAGLMVQVILAPACGDRGYENCFQDCPLSDPTVFNHNGLFHLIFMFGLIFFAAGEQIQISIDRGENTENEEGEKVETANNEETFQVIL